MPRPSPSKITVGTALRLTYRAFARDLARRLAPHGVTLLMWFVLRELWKRDGLSQREIAQATDRQASAIVSVVRELQFAGLVQVRRSPNDGRRSVVRLTRAGRRLEAVLTAHGKNLSQTAQRGFSPAEKHALMLMLRRLRHNIGSNGET
jgi:DNA-binding MarR family transcriptional regulator